MDTRIDWQIKCDKLIKNKDNVILSSPTGSGKTKRYEIWALNKKERPIFITSPIKALSNQKFRQLISEGYNVGLETGDIKYIPNYECDIICCTQEIYNNKYRDVSDSTLIVDEFSYIFDEEERARAYIDSLYYSKAKNIMLCSATFGNPNEIKEYINRLTNRDFYLFENKERLTTLEYKGEIKKEDIKNSLVVSYSSKYCKEVARRIYKDRLNRITSALGRIPYDPRNKNRNEINEVAKKYDVDNDYLIELATMGVAYYFGALYPKEKLFIEELFERRLIDVVVGTDALALGVNFPIENVIFTELSKTKDEKIINISKNLFEQLSGRAGRKGYFDKGYVYYSLDYCKTKGTKKLYDKLINANNESVNISLCPNIKDILNGDKTILEEASFITEYSTNKKEISEETKKINDIIKYIKSFDIVNYYIMKKFDVDLSLGYDFATFALDEHTKSDIYEVSSKLIHLKEYFDKDIGSAYLIEYSPELNCQLFVDIIMEESIENLISNYGKTLYDLLLLRKYMNRLPSKYSKCYNLKYLDERINSLDYTILHPEEFKMDKITKKEEVKKEVKKKVTKVYKCPNFFELISINNKEYIKLCIDNNKILVSEYYPYGEELKLLYFPTNTRYKFIKFFDSKERLDILNRVDINSLAYEYEEASDIVNGMKLSLTNENKKGRK